ncbi:hypothetical protein PFAG_02594 [Plasmodium falciparum Santa Lucia]|uniref:Uncharacterized protein n=12 Tax=Plasmodium falciparum TaxID=5833 RepID=Q8I2I7_PLAF7|nr:conserved Plasmodium protein, unknown function [Plasmodium falciparum 3D7]ETW18747.1 hypothetical protein PFFVO_02642 [Plasmodium falciparum Vietnam Oak-Knoll (FVO)]ETW36601.1 hypothetical protein PFTANZ_02671 [Plasmodium falciparum Tanzania (2000708)]ETW42872.1 hypothetical protein PFNF135_02766 [Plasmodium falciparum NF135/5.C10]ETW49311.1 hypothetical protein PFMALIP_02630 [Plasmodium falciparum MaliPS096_E11]ETW56818.1 hypothetical protein PFUGPA_01150 [Plasmodium falciparum Palo Alto/U|eukprot:XP_001352195.1 conserved Plasmodium protein, unknown function [Plasmodium falciparum 3D7]
MNKKNTTYDILPPPLEKIHKNVEKKDIIHNNNNIIIKEDNKCKIKNEDIKTNVNNTFDKNNIILNNNVADKYKNIILNINEINTILKDHPHFKQMVENENVTEFMDKYLINPIEAIMKYKSDQHVIEFLNTLFKYMNAKRNYIHINNLPQSFTFHKKK